MAKFVKADNFDAAFEKFLAGAQKVLDAYKEAMGYTYNGHKEVLVAMKGRKNVKVVRRTVYDDGSMSKGGSAHCFVDMTNGDVLKAASWKAPAKHARGNIFKDDNGLGAIAPQGHVNYLN